MDGRDRYRSLYGERVPTLGHRSEAPPRGPGGAAWARREFVAERLRGGCRGAGEAAPARNAWCPAASEAAGHGTAVPSGWGASGVYRYAGQPLSAIT